MLRFNRRQRSILKLIALNILLLALAAIWNTRSQSGSVAVAVAKGKQMLDMNYAAAPVLETATAERIALLDPQLDRLARRDSLEFVDAVRLTAGEARYWHDQGCRERACAHVVFYDLDQGGTVETIVDLEAGLPLGSWTNAAARPGGSTHVLPRAMAIAAVDEQVRAILGEIGTADPAMVPMSGWLQDDACREDWCVDLTFHDPNGSGRIYHVFVNMERSEVARTFYTRGREDRSAAKPIAQRDAFTDGCNEQDGWEVCWEMTANDGLNFTDASFEDQLVFSSAKIAQVEAWYPSWPGGYRDEIGFSATVPPFGDTLVTDLDDGFEVRQMFTEFTRWPNCICCYRYEQAIRFYDDGRLEFVFISHGPGCDDLSVYRPFWRIDVDLDGPEDDNVWLWQQIAWEEQLVEFETHPLVDDISPDGHNLATFDGDLHYRWSMAESDPLGLDEGYLFLLQFAENEGTGPIVTGPGDTYIPPRQWINGDPLSGENIVLWHVPLLKTKKGGPWYCMPDPEPDFSPCEAILHADPAGELRQPTAAELAAMPTAVPTAVASAPPAVEPTPRPVEGQEAEEIVLNAGCGACHRIGAIGEAHKVGPDLSSIGLLAGGRVAGMSAQTYIRQSILQPNMYLAPECPNGPCMPNIMPGDYSRRLSVEQLDTLVAFLLEQTETPTAVAAQGTESSEPAPKSLSAPKQTKRPSSTGPPPSTIAIQVLLLTLAFLFGLLYYFRESPEKGEPKG